VDLAITSSTTVNVFVHLPELVPFVASQRNLRRDRSFASVDIDPWFRCANRTSSGISPRLSAPAAN